jgi:predicted transcriptional regulator
MALEAGPPDTEGFESANPRSYTDVLEIELTPELQPKLERIASQQGRDTKSLVHEAVERLIGCDEWFLRQVEIGLAQADRGELL